MLMIVFDIMDGMDNILNMNSDLSPQQAIFVAEYPKTFCAKTAAIKAGYSPKTAHAQGCRLLKHVKVKELLAQNAQKRMDSCGVTASMVVSEMARLGFSDVREIASWGPDGVALKPSSELTDDAARCISEISETETSGENSSSRNLKIKMHSKVAALDLLAKHFGLLKEVHVNVDVVATIEELAAAARADRTARQGHTQAVETAVLDVAGG